MSVRAFVCVCVCVCVYVSMCVKEDDRKTQGERVCAHMVVRNLTGFQTYSAKCELYEIHIHNKWMSR